MTEGTSSSRRMERFFDHHPWLYGVAFALPMTGLILVMGAETGRLDELRTWVYASVVFGWGVLWGSAALRWRRGNARRRL